MSCNCGCGGCETKTQGPLLTEGKVKSLLSEGLLYHIEHKLPLFETVYRIGSDAHLALIKEARKMYSRNVIDLCEEDEALIGTHLGEFGVYEGESVPLDLPMINEGRALITFKNDYEVKINTGEGYDDDFEYFEAGEKEQVYILDKNDKTVHVEFGDGTNAFIPAGLISIEERPALEEAEFRGKDVPLNKPKRGGSKAYYVYVRDPKTKKIKKVSFGSGGLRAKIKNKEARNAFAKRHRCSEKKDRTKAGYWSCNLPRYASALGLGANMNTFW